MEYVRLGNTGLRVSIQSLTLSTAERCSCLVLGVSYLPWLHDVWQFCLESLG